MEPQHAITYNNSNTNKKNVFPLDRMCSLYNML